MKTLDETRKDFEEWIRKTKGLNLKRHPSDHPTWPEEYVGNGIQLAYEAYLEGMKKSEDTRRLDWCDRHPMPDFSEVGNDSGWNIRAAIDAAIKANE